MDLPSHIRPTPDVIISDTGDEILLLHMGNEHYYSLKGVGRRFWEETSKNPSVENAIGVLLDEFSVSEDILRADLASLYNKMAGQQLVEKVPAKA